MTNFCLGDEYLLLTKFFADEFFTDGFFTDKVDGTVEAERKHVLQN